MRPSGHSGWPGRRPIGRLLFINARPRSCTGHDRKKGRKALGIARGTERKRERDKRYNRRQRTVKAKRQDAQGNIKGRKTKPERLKR